jgi:hypothetical protein
MLLESASSLDVPVSNAAAVYPFLLTMRVYEFPEAPLYLNYGKFEETNL